MEFNFLDVFRTRHLARIVFVLILINSSEGVIDFTCTSNTPRITINGTDELYLTGYLSGSDTDATVTFDLEAFTGSAFHLPGTTLAGDVSAGYAARHVLPSDSGDDRVGAFSCVAEQQGVTNNVVITILSKHAVIVPLSQTHTVSIGDSINLEVTTTADPLPKLEWRKDGVLLEDVSTNQLILPIASATQSDAGIYECYEKRNRDYGQGSIVRLIVRACPEAKWGPPSCNNDCRVCYNGGVCDDQSGVCVCAPGFSGASCQFVHGRNHFGQHGLLQCSAGADRHDNSCQGQLFCMPDPYGCSCAAGYQGIDCLEECPEGMYGANCKQTCHCADGGAVCLKDTGECETGGCEAGWTGINCQEPDPCPSDYVGDVCQFKCNCPSTQTCVAKEDAAKCFTCISAASSAPADVLSMSISPTSVKFTWSAVQCTDTGMDLDLYEYKVINQADMGEVVTGETNSTEVIISGLTPCTDYAFSVAASTSVSAMYSSELVITTETQVPGVIQGLTFPGEINPDHTPISWQAPSSPCPVTQYSIEVTTVSRDQCQNYNETLMLTTPNTSAILTNLLAYSTAEIFIEAENTAGKGIGLSAHFSTSETVPKVPPPNVRVTEVTATSLSFAWDEIPCGSRGGHIKKYHYRVTNRGDSTDIRTAQVDTTSITVTSLTPCSDYTFAVAGTTTIGVGQISDELLAATGTVVPGEVNSLTISEPSNTTLLVSWQPAATPCSADEHVVVYTLTSQDQCQLANTSIEMVVQDGMTVTLSGLLPYSNYTVSVYGRNSVGDGPSVTSEWQTSGFAPTDGVQNITVSAQSSTELQVSWQPPTSSCIATKYLVEYMFTNQDQCADVNGGRRPYGDMFGTSLLLSGLVPYSTYTVFVRATNEAGDGPVAAVMGTTLETAPSAAPMGLSLTAATVDNLTFSWSEVACGNRGGHIQQYLYQITNAANSNIIGIGQTTNRTVTITGLMPCSSYHVSISAINSAGVGPNTELQSATAESAPSVIQNLTILPESSGDGFELSWQPPSGSCQPNIYRIEYLLINQDQCQATNGTRRTAGVATEPMFIVANLAPYSTYIIFVSASNIIGDSPARTITATTAQSTPRSAPVNVLVGNSSYLQLNISWQPPPCGSRNGPIISYTYKLTTVADKTEVTGDTTATELIFSNLTAGGEYMFVVAALTSVGAGPYSIPIMTSVNGHLEMTSTTPTVSTPLASNLTTSAPPWNVTTPSANLTTVMPINMTSPSGNFTTSAPNVTSPSGNFTTSAPNMTSPSGNFTTGAPNMTSPISNFTTSAPNVTSPSSNFTTIAPNMTSPSGNFTTSAPNMTSPSGNFTTGAPNMTSPSGNFTTSAPNMTSPIGNFTTSAPDMTSSGNFTTSGPFNFTTPSGYLNMTTVRVTSTHLPMTSPAVNMTSSTPNVTSREPTSTPSVQSTPASPVISTPGIPTDVSSLSSTVNSISIQWSPPDPLESPVISYEILYWKSFDGDEHALNISLEENFENVIEFTYNITNLNVSTNYSFKVRAKNAAGAGPWSNTITAQTQAYPKPYDLAVVNKTQTTLGITWSPPAGVSNSDIQAYNVTYRALFKPYDDSFIPADMVPHTSLPDSTCTECQTTLVGLEPSTQYEVQLTAMIDGSTSKPANLEAFTKVASGFTAPVIPKLNVAESTKSMVTIGLPSTDSKYISGFQVGVRRDRTRNRRADTPVFGSYEDSPDSYVAGEVGRSDTGFSVGDNNTYGGHYNPPLTEGEDYDIYVAYVSRTSDDAAVVWGDPLSVTAGDYGPVTGSKTGSEETLTITWIIIICGVALLIVVVLIIIIMVTNQQCKKRKKNQSIMFQNGTRRSLDAFPVDENDVDSKPVTSIISLKPIDNGTQKTNAGSPVMTTFSAPTHANGSHANGLPGIIDDELPVLSTSIPVRDLPMYIEKKKADSRKGFHVEYKMLPDGKQHEWNDAMEKENQPKNRYTNIVPYDHSRVRLHPKDGVPNSDYINACYINDYKQQRKYIACQGPKDETVADFWQMVWEHKATKIVMLTNCVELGKKKCAFYWPDLSKGVTQSFDTITVIPVSLEEFLDYTVRTFHMNKIGEDIVHTVKQFHFTSWPDMGVLQYSTPLLNFRKAVREYSADTNAHTIVHCSAGVGRTGAYIGLDTMLDQAQDQGMVDVYKFVSDMRQQRCKMVQTPEQYQFIYEAILEAVLSKNTSIAAASFEEEYTKIKAYPASGAKIPSLEEQFQLLEYLTSEPDVGSCKAATKTENLDKNRFKDRLPSDRVRPFLVTPVPPPSTDYINAALVPGYRKKNMYIATQMPLPGTIADIWRLVYDYKATSIVMLNVMDSSDETYGHYWPESGSHIYGGNLAVDFESSTKHTDSIMIRTYKMYTINNNSDVPSGSRTIQHYQFLDWYDSKGVPADSNEELLSLVTMVDQWQKKSGGGPIIVQCVDGVGCSGVYCSLSTILQRLEEHQVVDVFQTVKALRMVRPKMVETMAQYEFLYEAVQHHISAAGPSAL